MNEIQCLSKSNIIFVHINNFNFRIDWENIDAGSAVVGSNVIIC